MSKAAANIEIKVSDARIVSAELLDDGTCRLTIETEVKKVTEVKTATEVDETKQNSKAAVNKEFFELVEASTLSLQDEFMKYEPKTDEEKWFKQLLTDSIKKGLKDFYRPRLDPSFDENGEICYKCYKPGEKPTVGRSYIWWEKKAKAFCRERGSRLGTKTEYVAFLGVLLKRLVASGWKVQDAWNAVCNDSKELGHYWNSVNAKGHFEATGSRESCKFFDLANTCKILADDRKDGTFWLAVSSYYGNSDNYPPADLVRKCIRSCDITGGVGWLVLEK